MKKTITLIVLTLCFLVQIKAQLRVGDYKFRQDSSAYTPLGATAKVLDSSTVSAFFDDRSFTLGNGAIPFWFKFASDSFNSCTVTDNGVMTFGGTAPGTTNYTPLSSATGYSGAIAPLARDLVAISDTTRRGMLLWDTLGTAPNRIFVMEWRNFSNYTTSRTNYYIWNFQIRLYENGNIIQIVYDDCNRMKGTASTTNLFCQVGLRGPSNNFDTLNVNNRLIEVTNNASWLESTAGTANNSTCLLRMSPITLPTQGLTFTWTPATCLAPDSFSLATVDFDKVAFYYKARGNASQWIVEYDTLANFSTTKSIVLSGSNRTITGLSPATLYYARIRSLCGANDTSAFAKTLVFRTQCIPATSLPFTESFEGTYAIGNGSLPACWKNEGTKLSRDTISNTYNRTPRTGKGYISIAWNANDWVFLPQIKLQKNKIYELSFYYRTDAAADWDTLRTMVGSGQSAALMHTVIGSPRIRFRDTAYTHYKAYFTPSDSGNFTFGIQVRSGGSPWYLTMDDFKIDTVNLCVNPSDLRADSLTHRSTVLAWKESGLAGNWQIALVNGTANPNTGNTAFTNKNAFKIDTLASTTTYSFYVRAICGTNDTSNWTGPFTFTTPCTPISTFPWFEGFESVTGTGTGALPSCWTQTGNWGVFNTSTTSYNRSPRTGSNYLTARYGATDWIFSRGIELVQNKRYRLNFYYKTDGLSGWDSLVVFLPNTQQPGQIRNQIGTTIYYPGNTNFTLFNETFEVAQTGIYYLGMFVKSTSAPWYMTFDDFSIEEINDIDLGVDKILTETSGCGNSNTPLQVVVKNHGYLSASNYSVKAIISGATTDTLSLQSNKTLGFEQLDTLTLGTFSTANGGNYRIQSYVSIQNDKAASNDTLQLLFKRGRTPNNPIVVSDTICRGNSGTLRARSNTNTFRVYDAFNSFIRTTDSLFTFTPNATSTFKFIAVNNQLDTLLTQPSTTPASQLGTNGLIFSTTANTIIESVDIYYQANVNGSVTIAIKDSLGNLIARHKDTLLASNSNFSSQTAPHVIPVNFTLPPASYYRMELESSNNIISLQRETSANYPIKSRQFEDVTLRSGFSNGTSAAGYFYFYNWKLRINECISDTIQAVMAVAENPVFDIQTDTVCEGKASKIKEISNASEQITRFDFDNLSDGTVDFSWKGGDTSFVFPYPGTNFFRVTATNKTGCSTTQNYAAIVRGNPTVSIDGNDVCEGDTVELIARGAFSYVWENQFNGAIFYDKPTQNRSYKVRGTNVFGCAAEDSIFISLLSLPVFSIGNDTAICNNQTIDFNLNAQPYGSGFEWNDGSFLPTKRITHFGSYWVKVTNNDGCSATDTLKVIALDAPDFEIGGDTSFCSNTAFELAIGISNPTWSALWNDGKTDPIIKVTQAGTYGLTATHIQTLCSAYDEINIIVYDAPIVNLGNDTGFCANTPFEIELNAGNPGAFYNWNNGNTSRTLRVNDYGTYTVNVLDQWGCSNDDSITINKYDNPTVDLGSDRILNLDLPVSLILDAGNPNASYLWSNSANTRTIQVNDTGTYSVVVTSSKGCTGEGQVVVRFWNSFANVKQINTTLPIIYPNPGSDFIQIHSAQSPILSYFVIDHQGKKVAEGVPMQNLVTLNVKTLAAGTYFVQVVNESSTTIHKIIITQ